MRWRGLLLAALCALTATAAAPVQPSGEPRLSVRLKPVRAEIGDPVAADLELVVPAGLAVGVPIFPRFDGTWGDAEVVAVGEPRSEPAADGATRFLQTVALIPWTTGEVALPPPTVELPTATDILRITAARPAVLTVGSVLPEGDEEPAPRPPASPWPLPMARAFWWTLAAAASACLFAATLLLVRRRASIGAAMAVVIDPLTAFQRALDQLSGGDDPLVLIAGLSLALRRYLGRRLGFPAAESTTTEIRRQLQERGLPSRLLVGIDELLRDCDAVKFARLAIDREACGGPLNDAALLADGLEEHLRPPEPTGEREAA